MKRVGAETLVPVGAVAGAILVIVGCVRAFDAQEKRISLTQHETAVVARAQEKADARWEQVLSDLAKIKERLGIIESRPEK